MYGRSDVWEVSDGTEVMERYGDWTVLERMEGKDGMDVDDWERVERRIGG